MIDTMVSIITPVYNASAYIIYTIEAVVNQTYKDWEMILIDDCSTDDSVEIIRQYINLRDASGRSNNGNIRLYVNEYNMGAANSRNEGLRYARGRYISYLDADDIWKKNKIAIQIEYMRRNGYGFSYTTYEYGDSEGVGTGRYVNAKNNLKFKEALWNTIIFTSTVMLDIKKIDKRLMLMPDCPSEDSATWWRILSSGYIAHGIDENLVIYRRPAKSLSSNKIIAIRRIWFLYRYLVKMSIPVSIVFMVRWAIAATLRRI